MILGAFTVAIGLLGFIVGLSFQATTPETFMVSGVAAFGWILAGYLASSRRAIAERALASIKDIEKQLAGLSGAARRAGDLPRGVIALADRRQRKQETIH